MNGIQSAAMGYLARDAELRYTANGKVMLTFSLAVDDNKKAEGAETEWLRVVCFGELAEELAPRLTKGVHCYVEGRCKLNRWEAADGSERCGLELLAWVCQALGQIGKRRPRPQREPTAPDREHSDSLLPF